MRRWASTLTRTGARGWTEFLVSDGQDGVRADRWMAQFGRLGDTAVPHSMLRRWERKRFMLRRDSTGATKRLRCADRVRRGDAVLLRDHLAVEILPDAPAVVLPPSSEAPSWLRNSIVYMDADVIVLDKPRGWDSQPGGTGPTMHEVLPFLADDRGLPHIVHRLDKQVSGILLLARSRLVAARLGDLLHHRKLSKTYIADVRDPIPSTDLVQPCFWIGSLPRAGRSCVRAIAPGRRSPQACRRALLDQGASIRTVPEIDTVCEEDMAITRVSLMSPTRLSLSPVTGRNHQLRQQVLLATGQPITGDAFYGGTNRDRRHLPAQGGRSKLALRAVEIAFPSTDRKLPGYMQGGPGSSWVSLSLPAMMGPRDGREGPHVGSASAVYGMRSNENDDSEEVWVKVTVA